MTYALECCRKSELKIQGPCVDFPGWYETVAEQVALTNKLEPINPFSLPSFAGGATREPSLRSLFSLVTLYVISRLFDF